MLGPVQHWIGGQVAPWRLARLVKAILVCGVVSAPSVKGDTAFGAYLNSGIDDNPRTKFSAMTGGALKYIAVLDPAPNKAVILACPDGQEILNREWKLSQRVGGAAWDHDWRDCHINYVRVVEIWRQDARDLGASPAIYSGDYLPRRGPAYVSKQREDIGPHYSHYLVDYVRVPPNAHHFEGNKGTLDCIKTVLCDHGRARGDTNRGFHVAGLTPAEIGQASGRNKECNSSSEESRSEKGKLCGQVNKSPVKVRFFFALACLFGTFGLSFLGWMNMNNNRRLRGVLLVAAGAGLGAGGLTLFWLSRFTWTWGWWL